MEIIISFGIAFVFSFIGTIPPGTLNLTAIQLGLEGRIAAAWRFSIAAALIEYGYAWIAIAFEETLSLSVRLTGEVKLFSALLLISLGVFHLWVTARKSPSGLAREFSSSGFWRGLVLSVLNPLALPFWLAVTAYIKGQGWIDLSSPIEIHAYLLGVSTGAIALLMLCAATATVAVRSFKDGVWLKRLPAIALIALGLYEVFNFLS